MFLKMVWMLTLSSPIWAAASEFKPLEELVTHSAAPSQNVVLKSYLVDILENVYDMEVLVNEADREGRLPKQSYLDLLNIFERFKGNVQNVRKLLAPDDDRVYPEISTRIPRISSSTKFRSWWGSRVFRSMMCLDDRDLDCCFLASACTLGLYPALAALTSLTANLLQAGGIVLCCGTESDCLNMESEYECGVKDWESAFKSARNAVVAIAEQHQIELASLNKK
jgi:hypothetical protein